MAAPTQNAPPVPSFCHVNRPIHLARRDAFFERAVELLRLPIDPLPAASRQSLILQVTQALQVARQHAFYTAVVCEGSTRDSDFLRFLDLIIRTVQSVEAMVDHQVILAEEAGFLSGFLRANPEEFRLPAMHFERRAEDIIDGLWHILRLAQGSFHSLRSEAREEFDEPQRVRYDRALGMAREEARGRFAPIAMG